MDDFETRGRRVPGLVHRDRVDDGSEVRSTCDLGPCDRRGDEAPTRPGENGPETRDRWTSPTRGLGVTSEGSRTAGEERPVTGTVSTEGGSVTLVVAVGPQSVPTLDVP